MKNTMKNNIIYLILFTFCSCFSLYSNAQSAPGLLGKRVIVSYDLKSSLNYLAPDYETDSNLEAFGSLLTYKHAFAADYVLTRTLSIGLDYGFQRQRLEDAYINGEDFEHRLRANEIGIRLKYFPIERAGIAPIGPYFQFRAMRYAYRSEMTLMNDVNLDEPYTFPFEEGAQLAGSFGFGRQGIITGNIMYNIGCEMGIVITENAFADLGYYSTNLRNTVFVTNLFKAHFGIAVPIY